MKVQIEEDGKKCNCSSVECKCTCCKCVGPPHYEYAPRYLPKRIKHKVRMRRPALVMYLLGVAEGGEGNFCVPPMDLNRLCSHYVTLQVTPESGDTQNSLTEFPHFHIPKHTISEKVVIPNQIVSRTNSDKARITIANLNDHPVKIDNVNASGQ